MVTLQDIYSINIKEVPEYVEESSEWQGYLHCFGWHHYAATRGERSQP